MEAAAFDKNLHQGQQYYTIQQGDSIDKIAKHFAVNPAKLCRRNGLQDYFQYDKNDNGIPKKNIPIFAGKKLIIPSINRNLIDKDKDRQKVFSLAMEHMKKYQGDISFQKAKGYFKNNKFYPYLDCQNIWTIGYGTTDSSVINNYKSKGMSISQAELLLNKNIRICYNKLLDEFDDDFVDLSIYQKVVLISLSYNTGKYIQQYKGFYNNLKNYMKNKSKQNLIKVSNSIKSLNKGAKSHKTVNGLVVRREEEAKMFLKE